MLTISGEGAMHDYTMYEGSLAPWSEKVTIHQFVFAEGCTITHIGNYAFGCSGELKKFRFLTE